MRQAICARCGAVVLNPTYTGYGVHTHHVVCAPCYSRSLAEYRERMLLVDDNHADVDAYRCTVRTNA
jgi:hypothetical protein